MAPALRDYSVEAAVSVFFYTCKYTHSARKRPRMSNPKMSNPRMSNPKMSNAKMSNRVLISTVPGESTWNVINTIILKCSSVFPLAFLAQREVGIVRFFGNNTERTLCTKSVDIRKRGDSIRMIVTIALL